MDAQDHLLPGRFNPLPRIGFLSPLSKEPNRQQLHDKTFHFNLMLYLLEML